MKNLKCIGVALASLSAVVYVCVTHSAQAQTKGADNRVQQYDERAKRYGQLLQEQQELDNRAKALVTSQEELVRRQQTNCERFEKVLSTWEAQQRQYQAYLDSLKK